MKKYLALALSAIMVLALMTGCGAPAEPAEEVVEPVTEEVQEEVQEKEAAVQTIVLGTSAYSITVDASFAEGDISSEDTDESQVAYYASESTLVDFDVYQWAKATDETLADAAAAEAAEYESEAAEVEFNGIAVFAYNAVEEYEGTEYNTVTYMMEDGDNIVELVFWLDGDDAQAEVDTIMATLTKAEAAEEAASGTTIVLGTSAYSITPEKAYEEGEISSEDTDESQVAYYTCADSLVDFDVYQWAKATDETLADAAAAEAAEYESEAAEVEFNGIAVFAYNAVEEYEGTEYNTVTYMMEDGDNIVELVFWLDGDNAQAEVDTIMATLTR